MFFRFVNLLSSPRHRLAAWLALFVAPMAGAAEPGEATPSAFDVVYTAEVHPGPITGRVYVMLAGPGERKEPRQLDDWFRPLPVFAVEARGWRPGEKLRVGPDADGHPGPPGSLRAGSSWVAQAIVRLNPDARSIGEGPGNGYSRPVRVAIDPEADGAALLTIDRNVSLKAFQETDRIKLVEIPSPLLSAFYHRPIRHRAAVIWPEGERNRPLATLYIVPGFGGDASFAHEILKDPRLDFGRSMLRVVLDPSCGTGHHAFADSANNGPRGRALVEELIPHIEKTFPARSEARARLLWGHSSGGWSTLWLQISHPETFGGTWSTSPDPVDFRDFQRIDLYEPGANLYRDPAGKRRPIARLGPIPVLFFDDFARRESVLGDGGQLGSFEAVFSPAGPDGRPRPLWDRKTGAVDHETALAWEKYDIRLVLERDWPTLGPKLAGKLRVVTGALDTFYLEGAVKLLKESLARLGTDAVVEVVPGRDHSTVLDRALADRFDREMNEASNPR